MSIHNPQARHLPVRPNLDQLKHQAKDLLRAIRAGEPDALEEFRKYHPQRADKMSAGLTPDARAPEVTLADAQFVLARSYEVPSWPRLVQCCQLIDAIWNDDVDAVRNLILSNPHLLTESALVRKNNWGPPMSYAANVGRNEIVRMLHDLGATDHRHAIDRAMLQSRIDTARLLYDLMGRPPVPDDALGGPAYTLSVSGTAFALEFGARVLDAHGKRIAPVDVVLETDSRNPEAKHAILELYSTHGLELPDTPAMAVHRGRVDLLEEHLRRDPQLLSRTFTHEEIYPPDMGCHDEINATQGTPLKGTTLLHLCVDYDEIEIARWLLAQGMNVDAKAAVDEEGFGGHTALFGTVVSQPNFWMNYKGGWARNRKGLAAPFAELLLAHGADPNLRASLRKKLHPGYGPKYDVENTYEYRNVTPLAWGRRFHAKVFVSEPAMQLIEAGGGVE